MRFFITAAISLVTALSAANLGWADARVTAVSGIVRAYATGSDSPLEVTVGQILSDGMEVRTAETGRVTLEFGAGNTVRLRGNGRIVLAAPEANKSRVQLLAGKLKGMFSRLTGGRRFELEFPNGAVCAVKGTEIVAEVSPGEAYLLNVLFGAASLLLDGQSHGIPQGCGATFGGAAAFLISVLTDQQVTEGTADWGQDQLPWEGGPPDTSADEREKRREALRDLIADLRTQIQQAQEQTALIREEDFAAGRTLRDVHGNLTRVDQRLGRPNPSTIQFINLVKRDSYYYKGRYTYRGSNGPRYDYAAATIEMNMAMPDSLFDWPQFISDCGDDLEPVWAELELANGIIGDSGKDTIKQTTEWNVDDPETPDIIETDYTKSTLTINGTAFVSYDGDENTWDLVLQNGISWEADFNADGEATDDLWTIDSEIFLVDGDRDGIAAPFDPDDPLYRPDQEFVWMEDVIFLNTEAFVINNDGKILNANDFTDNTLDPFTVLKNTAVEAIFSASSEPQGQGESRLNRGNIDIVVTPDIVLTAVEKVASALGDFDFDSDDEDSTDYVNDRTLPALR